MGVVETEYVALVMAMVAIAPMAIATGMFAIDVMVANIVPPVEAIKLYPNQKALIILTYPHLPPQVTIQDIMPETI